MAKISSNLPSDDYVKVVRQDPHNPNLLFAGMEHGIFASWDMGKIGKKSMWIYQMYQLEILEYIKEIEI